MLKRPVAYFELQYYLFHRNLFPFLLILELVHDMHQIFVKCLFCDWQSEPVICDDVLVSSFFAFTPVKCKSLSI